MEYQYLKEGVLTTQSLIDSIKEQTQYRADNLQGSFPFLRADRTGHHKIVIVLIRKETESGAYIPTQIVNMDLATGALISRESADKFYATQQLELVPHVIARTNIDPAVQKQYKAKILPLMDRMRLDILENGETDPNVYLEYLNYTLYGFTDEFAQVFLRASRIYITAKSMEVACSDCHRKFMVSTTNMQNGAVSTHTCPFCQNKIQTAYKKTGRCITFADKYMQAFRNTAAAVAEKDEQSATPMESIIDTEGTFAVEESVKLKEEQPLSAPVIKEPALQTPPMEETYGEQDRGYKDTDTSTPEEYPEEDTEEAILPNIPNAPQEFEEPTTENPLIALPDYFKNVHEEKVHGLSHQKNVFSVVRYMLFESEYDTPPVILTLQGEKGCGIRTSILNLSGFSKENIYFVNMEKAAPEDFVKKPCTVLLCKEAFTKHYDWLTDAVLNMKKGSALFIAGNTTCIESLMDYNPLLEKKVIYNLLYKPYDASILCSIFTDRMEEYGIDGTVVNKYKQELFSGKDAQHAIQLCSRLYFKHILAVAEEREDIEGEVLAETELNQELARIRRNSSQSNNTNFLKQ